LPKVRRDLGIGFCSLIEILDRFSDFALDKAAHPTIDQIFGGLRMDSSAEQKTTPE
jgi:hypothetical protein